MGRWGVGVQAGSSSGSYTERIVRVGGQESALTIAAVYRAGEVRAKTMGQLVMQYQRLNREGGNFVANMYGEGKRLNYMLQVQPNPVMSASVFFQQMELDKLFRGNALIYIERGPVGEPLNFWLCNQGSYDMATGQYVAVGWLSEHGQRFKPVVDAADIIHIPNTYRYPGTNWGMSTVRFACNTLSLAATETSQALDIAAKGGRVKILVGEEQRGGQGLLSGGLYDKGTMNTYADEINSRIYSSDVVALRGLDKVVNISMSAADQQLIQIVGMTQDDVARFFGVPRPLLMIDSNSNYKTPEAATQELLTREIQPAIRYIEDEFNRKLLTVDDFDKRRFHLCELPLMRLDKRAQAQTNEILLRIGAKSVNEIRAEYDLPAVDGGDVLYLLTNLAELGSDKLRSFGGTAPTQEQEPTRQEQQEQEGGEQ